MSKKCVFITAADAAYFPFVRGAIQSVRDQNKGQQVTLACFDLGCTPQQRAWLEQQVELIQIPDWDFEFPGREQAPHYLRGLLARPFLRRYFPGFDLYLWLDADAWVQDWSAVDLFLRGAARRGLAIVPEIDRGSFLQYGHLPRWWENVRQFYEAPYGPEVAARLQSYPLLNAGVFALRRDAPHWERWAEALHRGLQRRANLLSDQTALNLVVYAGGLFEATELLPAWCNWTCHFGLPVFDEDERCLVEPYLPHHRIGIMHLTGPKRDRYSVKTTHGGGVELDLRYPSSGAKLASLASLPSAPAVPVQDYVSPGLVRIDATPSFPCRVVGDVHHTKWPYLRRKVSHTWYVDRRAPTIGFLNTDETHLLYNFALQFRDRRALEIGCWYGWSACHLALAGTVLDVVDPLLDHPELRQSVMESLRSAGILDRVQLRVGYSPQAVEELAQREQRRWSFFFIDGDHDGPAPLQDAVACEHHAAEDAAILFHDLASPDVATGLDYLRRRGWKTLVYQTMQIMGAAWRGCVRPVAHQPDPGIAWQLSRHLQGYSVSGVDPDAGRGGTARPPGGIETA